MIRAGTAVTTPCAALAVIGLGGLFAGVTGPLVSTFVPPLVRDALGDQRTTIGAVMAIDNVLLLLLLPWAGPASDRASARGRGRLAFIIGGFLLAALGMAALPYAPAAGLAALIGALVLLHGGINVQRAPFQALIADIIPSRDRSLATGSMTFQMSVAAVGFLMLGRILGMRVAFLTAAVTVVGIAVVLVRSLRTPRTAERHADVSYRSLAEGALAALRGSVPGLRALFVAALLLQLTFQSFSTWYALHATERFAIPASEVTTGFIAWALGGVIGALPAGVLGRRIGRRNAILAGFAAMTLCLLALDRVSSPAYATPLLGLAAVSWALPMVNAYPLFIEPIPREHRGILASLFLLSMALGGAIGDPLNGRLFDLSDGYRPLFLLMALYTAMAFAAVWMVPRGSGEASS